MTQKTAGNHHYPGLDPASPKYRDLVENLVTEYRPLAKTLCQAVLRTLNKSEESLQGQSGKFLLLVDTQPVHRQCGQRICIPLYGAGGTHVVILFHSAHRLFNGHCSR